MISVIESYNLALCAIVTIGIQLFFFAIANTFKFDKVTDIAGSMNFVILACLTFFLSHTYYIRQIICTILVTVWGLRLGIFLLYRVVKRGKDERFDEMRESCCQFFIFWIFQMIWVFTVSLSVIFLQSAGTDVSIGVRDIIGWCLWGIGFVCQSLADFSKSAFNADPANKGRLLQSNIWYYSRHPNYFGEILIWLGIFLTCSSVFSSNSPSAYVSVLSPVITFILLVFVSGIPPAEERYDKRYGNCPIYSEYKLQTSPLIPFPPIWYSQLPHFIQIFVCLELPMYSQHFRTRSSQSYLTSTNSSVVPSTPTTPTLVPTVEIEI